MTAKSEVIDRILGLELGGDDYITKLFNTRAFILRVKNILERVYEADGDRKLFQAGDHMMDVEAHEVRVGNQRTELTSGNSNWLLV